MARNYRELRKRVMSDPERRKRVEAIMANNYQNSPKGREAYDHLIALHQIFRAIDREDLEDQIADILDQVTGWCSEHVQVEWPDIEKKEIDNEHNQNN